MLCWLISLFIIPHYLVFVKYFFQVFSKTFSWWSLLWKQLNYYITTSFICQPLFRSFSNLFCCDVVSLVGQLNHYTTSKRFCQVLFAIFSKKLLQTCFPKSRIVSFQDFSTPVRQLYYYIIKKPDCQQSGFTIFFKISSHFLSDFANHVVGERTILFISKFWTSVVLRPSCLVG